MADGININGSFHSFEELFANDPVAGFKSEEFDKAQEIIKEQEEEAKKHKKK